MNPISAFISTPQALPATLSPTSNSGVAHATFKTTGINAMPRLNGLPSAPLSLSHGKQGLLALGVSAHNVPESLDAKSDDKPIRRAPNLLTFETERSVELAEAADKKKAPLPEGERPNYLKFETAESMRKSREANNDSKSPGETGRRDLLRFEN